jgi:imidazolonepropionase-like amidohydrolase
VATPQLRGIDAINPLDIAFQDAVKCGVTTVMSGPGSENVVGGQSIALKTSGLIIDQMVLRNPVGFKVAFGENPITAYGNEKKAPVTRMGTAALIRELFMRTEDYLEQKQHGNLRERDIRLEAVIPVLKGEIPLRAHAHRVDDIATAIRIGNPASWKTAVAARDESGGLIEKVTDEEITEAQKLLAATEGVFCEPASAASVAGVIKKAKEGFFTEKCEVVCILTGHGLKDPKRAM